LLHKNYVGKSQWSLQYCSKFFLKNFIKVILFLVTTLSSIAKEEMLFEAVEKYNYFKIYMYLPIIQIIASLQCYKEWNLRNEKLSIFIGSTFNFSTFFFYILHFGEKIICTPEYFVQKNSKFPSLPLKLKNLENNAIKWP
jgi:hypothetical protein